MLLNGGPMHFLPRFDTSRVIALLPESTVFMGVPTYYTRLLGDPAFKRDRCRKMRLFISGSAPLLQSTFKEFQARSGHHILERYGMTETGMLSSNPLNGPRIAGSVGFPLPGVTTRIIAEDGHEAAANEIGVLQVKGPNVCRGYWRKPEKNREDFSDDGYFITGDLVRADSEGRLSIVGRSRDLIISGGLNVYPKEVELLIDLIPGVKESAVFGVPHPDYGEAVVAAVVCPEASIDESVIIGHLKKQLAGFKCPQKVFFLEDLPRNTMAKVQKNRLRDLFVNAFEH